MKACQVPIQQAIKPLSSFFFRLRRIFASFPSLPSLYTLNMIQVIIYYYTSALCSSLLGLHFARIRLYMIILFLIGLLMDFIYQRCLNTHCCWHHPCGEMRLKLCKTCFTVIWITQTRMFKFVCVFPALQTAIKLLLIKKGTKTTPWQRDLEEQCLLCKKVTSQECCLSLVFCL